MTTFKITGKRIGRELLVAALFLCLAVVTASPVRAQAGPTPVGSWVDRRAGELVAQMTLAEKVSMLHGAQPPVGVRTVGYVPGVPRLGIPPLTLTDGPAGVRNGEPATALPAPVSLSASFDRELAFRYGAVMGAEARARAQDVLLAPMVNIVRVPQGGRNFETLGEDPYLAAQLVVPEVRGIQSTDTIAQVKHYAANNQENQRGTISAEVEERTLREIYLPAFEAAVTDAGAGSAMCAYNRVNGTYACENTHLLTEILKAGWQFQGFVTSDWGATHSTVGSATAGLDLEMPQGTYYGQQLIDAVNTGQVTEATIDEHVHRILREMLRFGVFDRTHEQTPIDVPRHGDLARHAAEQGTVLLKNDGPLLPLVASELDSIAVIGPYAARAYTGGGGSSHVTPFYSVSPLEGIRSRAGEGVSVRTAATDLSVFPAIPASALSPSTPGEQGLRGDYFANATFTGTPGVTRTDPQVAFDWGAGSPAAGIPNDRFSVRWAGTLTAPTTGKYTLALTSDDGSRLYLDGQLLIDNWGDHAAQTRTAPVNLTAGESHTVRLEYYENGGDASITLGWRSPGPDPVIAEAAEVARSSDVAVVVVGDVETEGVDRASLALPEPQDVLVEAVAAANPKTIVVLNTGAPVLMPWVGEVPALMETWYPGQEDGNALASVLFGDVNPSGKLPVTFPASANDVPANTPERYPGVDGQAMYSEGLAVGYRHYDQAGIQPLFPFGYGLSYTRFRYSDLVIQPSEKTSQGNVSVTLKLTNTGDRAGAEVVQLYLGFPEDVGEPPKQLKGFDKVFLQPGQTKTVHLLLRPRDLSYWDSAAGQWVVPKGKFTVAVGGSSRHTPLTGQFTVAKTKGVRSLTLAAPSLAEPADGFTATTTFTNASDYPATRVRVALDVPQGWQSTATDPTQFNRVEPRATTVTHWTVHVPEDTKPGSYQLTAAASYAGVSGGVTSATARVYVAGTLEHSYNNVGISDDTDPSKGNFDGAGYSYSAQALASVGLQTGATVNHDGITFTWPNVLPGTPDNITASGQIIKVTGSGSELGFLGASAFGTGTGTGQIAYTDGSTQQYTLTMADWYANQPAPGTELLATAPYWNTPPGSSFGPRPVSVYYQKVPLDPGKHIAYVTLPHVSDTVGQGIISLHLFAIGTG